MDTDAHTDDETLVEQGRLIAAVERFEAAWRAGRGPRIEDYLEGVAGPRRSRWLCELIRLELELRARAGEAPRPEEYLDRFAGRSTAVAAAFADLNSPPAPEADAPGGWPGAVGDDDADSEHPRRPRPRPAG
jgi:hypothetical protein